LSCLLVHNRSFAFFQRDGEFSFVHGDRVLAENLIAPAIQDGDLPVLVGGKFWNVFAFANR